MSLKLLKDVYKSRLWQLFSQRGKNKALFHLPVSFTGCKGIMLSALSMLTVATEMPMEWLRATLYWKG